MYIYISIYICTYIYMYICIYTYILYMHVKQAMGDLRQ